MNEPKLIVCHFTLEELLYINESMVREKYMTEYLNKQLKGLEMLGVRMTYMDENRVNFLGKLLSYIKKGERERNG